MPISIDQFDSEPEELFEITAGSQPDRILRFLASNAEQAFTQTEIHEGTGIKQGSVGAVLSRLEDRGLVRHRGRYWAIGEDDRLASFAAQRLSRKSMAEDDTGTTYTDEESAGLPDIGERE